MARGEGVGDELEKSACGMAGDDVEWDQGVFEAYEIFGVGIENALIGVEKIVLLPAALKSWEKGFRVQLETQTSRPLTETFRLAGERGRPKWAST